MYNTCANKINSQFYPRYSYPSLRKKIGIFLFKQSLYLLLNCGSSINDVTHSRGYLEFCEHSSSIMHLRTEKGVKKCKNMHDVINERPLFLLGQYTMLSCNCNTNLCNKGRSPPINESSFFVMTSLIVTLLMTWKYI